MRQRDRLHKAQAEECLCCFIAFFHCLIAWYVCNMSLALLDVPHTSVVRYSLFMPKVPLNTKQTKQTNPKCWCCAEIKSISKSATDTAVYCQPVEWYKLPFSALTLLFGRQEGYPACKKPACWFVVGDDLTGALHPL